MGSGTNTRGIALEAQRVERVYAALARVYDGFFDWALAPGRLRAVGKVPAGTDAQVLEIGVGTGLSLPHYPADCRVLGVDISPAMLERARRRVEQLGHDGIRLRHMDARSLTLEDASFDWVLAPYVMSVVPDPERVMSEMARVCRPGGTIVVVNRFGSRFPPMRWIERGLTPISQWLGFRLDLQLERLTGTADISLERVERVNLGGLWRLVAFRRER